MVCGQKKNRPKSALDPAVEKRGDSVQTPVEMAVEYGVTSVEN